MTEFLSCRPNLEVGELAPAAAFLRDVLGFEVEVDEPEMGLMLLRRDTAGLALVRSANPGINATTAAYIGVTGVDDLHERCAARGAPVVTGLTGHPWACATLWWRCPAVTGWHSASGSPSPARVGTGKGRALAALNRGRRRKRSRRSSIMRGHQSHKGSLQILADRRFTGGFDVTIGDVGAHVDDPPGRIPARRMHASASTFYLAAPAT